jgi:hypothetical protein
MGRAGVLFGACAIAVGLLAGTAGAIASADPADSSAGESASASTSDDDQSANQQPIDNANTYGDNDRSGGEETTAGGGEESGGEESAGKDDAPVADDSGLPDDRDGRTANRMPSKLPLAPPANLGPLPEELPPLPLEPPLPPADVPPSDPDVVDVTMLGPGASPSEGNDSPAMKLPAIVAPPAPPVHILGTSITARWTLRPAITSPSRGAGEPSPPPRLPTTGLREPPITSAGVSFPGQTANRIGLTKEGLPRVRLLEMVAGALPGIGGMIVMTAAGVCLGHRQATAANQLRAHGLDHFLV